VICTTIGGVKERGSENVKIGKEFETASPIDLVSRVTQINRRLARMPPKCNRGSRKLEQLGDPQ
jgi:hypothetical protein